jgi:hypothetical protein
LKNGYQNKNKNQALPLTSGLAQWRLFPLIVRESQSHHAGQFCETPRQKMAAAIPLLVCQRSYSAKFRHLSDKKKTCSNQLFFVTLRKVSKSIVMQVVSSTEFATHQQKYFDLAHRQKVLVQSGNFAYRIMPEPIVEERVVFAPDEDFYNSISKEQLLEGIFEDMDKIFAKK